MSPSARRAEHRVGRGVADDVGIRITERAARRRNVDPAEHQRPALDQPVQVVAGAHPFRHDAYRFVAQAPPRFREIVGRGDLQVLRRGFDDVHDVAGALGERRFVGRFDARLAQRDGVPQDVDAESLRRLREENRFAGNRLDDRHVSCARLTRFTVSLTGCAAIAAPCSAAARMVRVIRSPVTSGRAAS